MNELKGISGIDKAVYGLVAELKGRKETLLEEIKPLATVATTADNLAERKADRAAVNKKRTAFETERKEIEKKWKAAIAPISDEYKAISQECDMVIKAIDSDLSEFENQRIEAKRVEIKKIFEETEKPAEVADWIKLEDIFNEKWLNATATKKKIQKEIEEHFTTLSFSYGTLKSLKHRFEAEGLEVLRKTRNLQLAIAKMTECGEIALKIENPEPVAEPAKVEPEAIKFLDVPAAENDFPFGLPEESTPGKLDIKKTAEYLHECFRMVYCDTCKAATEELDEEGRSCERWCDECHRKMMNWGLSLEDAYKIAEEIEKFVL